MGTISTQHIAQSATRAYCGIARLNAEKHVATCAVRDWPLHVYSGTIPLHLPAEGRQDARRTMQIEKHTDR